MKKTPVPPKMLRRYDYAVQRLLRHLLLRGYAAIEVTTPVPGDLILLGSAPDSAWHLSLYVEKVGGDEHMLESLRTGEHCKWSNVRTDVISRKFVSDWRQIRWSDEQFRFSDMFTAECRKADYYLNVPFIRGFTETTVQVGVRTRFHADALVVTADLSLWREASRSDIRKFLAALVAAHAAKREEAKNERNPKTPV